MGKVIDLTQQSMIICKTSQVVDIMKALGFENITSPACMLNTAGRFMTIPMVLR